MKVLLYGRNGHYPLEIEKEALKNGLEIIDPSTSLGMTTADAVVTYGGDGTLLGAERDYPGVPKLPIKDSDGAFKYSTLSAEKLLEMLASGRLKTKEFSKLGASFENLTLTAANDVVIRNSVPNIALRFSLTVNGEPVSTVNPLIGDGVIIASPFGSSGYFYSATRRTFENGIGVAFNNLHNIFLGAHILGENSEIKVEIICGPASLGIDNDPQIIVLKDGDSVAVKLSSLTTKILIP